MLDKIYMETLTVQLLQFTDKADKIYESVREEGKERDFYREVKPFVDEVDAVLKLWTPNMREWMKAEDFTHLFPQQIEQTANNLADVVVQAFFPKTSYKRFKSHIQSVRFILQNVLTEIQHKL
ncbi:YppE family protein [Peribacillus loiseleuriae]|uniref:YppE family protein n=1 Tax=Peribacillus loiseleuriae TaxID=1679170 RepID=UPI003CFCF73F